MVGHGGQWSAQYDGMPSVGAHVAVSIGVGDGVGVCAPLEPATPNARANVATAITRPETFTESILQRRHHFCTLPVASTVSHHGADALDQRNRAQVIACV
jgi:hypothetical protein